MNMWAVRFRNREYYNRFIVFYGQMYLGGNIAVSVLEPTLIDFIGLPMIGIVFVFSDFKIYPDSARAKF